MGRQGGRPGGGGTRLANCCICSPLPSAPSEIPGSQRGARARGSGASLEAEEATEGKRPNKLLQCGTGAEGTHRVNPSRLWRQPTPLAARRLRNRLPGAAFSSSVKFLKAAGDSEEARKVPGRTDACLCPPPLHPAPPPGSPVLLLPPPSPRSPLNPPAVSPAQPA